MSTAPRIGVLAVQGDVREHVRALEASGAGATTVRRPAELELVDGLVVPGGESTTMDKLVRAFALYEPLRARIAAGMPAYGSCAGMIMLADRIADGRADQQTLGGLDITVRRNAFGRQVDSFEEDLHIHAIGGAPLRAVFIRAPWVEECGPGVEVLATVEEGRPQDGSWRCAKVVCWRPPSTEMTGDHRFHELFVQMVRDARAEDARAGQ